MFNIYVNDGKTDIKDDICYIIGKDGIYLKKKMGIFESTAKVSSISSLQPVSTFAKMDIKKIPKIEFSKIVRFFEDVYSMIGTEVAMLLYYNPNTKEYRFEVPSQTVSAASCNYTINHKSPQDFLLLGTIHSHGRMCAGHSNMDDKDEKDFDGLHITIGDVDSNNGDFSISCSITANGERFIIKPEDYIESIQASVESKSITKVMGFHSYYSTSQKYFIEESDEEIEYPFHWLTSLKYEEPRSQGYGGIIHNSNYSSMDKSVVYKKPEEVEETTVNKGFIPCDHCVFKNYKLSPNRISDDMDDMISYWEPDDDYFEM